MPKYSAYMQNRSGCDYTIGCNTTLVELEGTTMQEAREFLEREITSQDAESDRRYFTESAGELDEITIFEVTDVLRFDSASVDALRERYKQEQQKRKTEREQSAKRAEYERLKMEFEG